MIITVKHISIGQQCIIKICMASLDYRSALYDIQAFSFFFALNINHYCSCKVRVRRLTTAESRVVITEQNRLDFRLSGLQLFWLRHLLPASSPGPWCGCLYWYPPLLLSLRSPGDSVSCWVSWRVLGLYFQLRKLKKKHFFYSHAQLKWCIMTSFFR